MEHKEIKETKDGKHQFENYQELEEAIRKEGAEWTKSKESGHVSIIMKTLKKDGKVKGQVCVVEGEFKNIAYALVEAMQSDVKFRACVDAAVSFLEFRDLKDEE